MATPPPPVGTRVGALGPPAVEPSLVVLVLLIGVVAALLYAYQPPIPQSIPFAILPWIVTGLLLEVLATEGRYPDYLLPLLTAPGAYLLALFVPGVVWVGLLNVTASRHELPAFHHYIGSMGAGAMLVLWSGLLHVGAGELDRMLILVVVSIVALLATGLVCLTIGLWSPDFIEYAAISGGFAVFGAFVHGIATATGVAVGGETAHTAFSATVWQIVVVVAPGGVAGVGVDQLWVWLFLVANVAAGIHVATQLAPYASRSPRAVHAMLGVVGVAGFAVGFDHLLRVVVG